MNLIQTCIMLVFLIIVAKPIFAEEDHVARGLVIQSVVPNKLKVKGSEFKTMPNPQGEGVFVYDPRTRFYGVKRNLIWLVLNEIAYPLNGSSKMITPNLKWPREVPPEAWEKTGLSPYSATDAIELVFSD